MTTTQQSLPLERRLEEFATSATERFPVRTANYWSRYMALLGFLRTQIYPQINAGLACLSKSPGIYTDHGADHFDEVVRYAGNLIEPAFSNDGTGGIEPYDLYLLLSAIRLHDAGNIDGREDHEKRPFALLKQAGAAVCPNDDEAYLIAQIAQAHGGATDGGDKDTIRPLGERSGMGAVWCHPQMVAALVRFADEICEHSARASAHHLVTGTLPAHSYLFHLYADSVKSAIVDREQKSFSLRLVFDSARLRDLYITPKHTTTKPDEKYLLDDAVDRIEKLDTERIYCNRFLPPQFRTERIDVQFDISRTETVSGQEIKKAWISKSFTIQEQGYPSPNKTWRAGLNKIKGSKVASKLAVRAAR